jgi:hypothetical protein
LVPTHPSTRWSTPRRTCPAITVLASFDPSRLEAEADAIRRLAGQVPLVLSGPGATEPLCQALRLQRLEGDLIIAAREIAQRAPA